jgi:hypothetical protein
MGRHGLAARLAVDSAPGTQASLAREAHSRTIAIGAFDHCAALRKWKLELLAHKLTRLGGFFEMTGNFFVERALS